MKQGHTVGRAILLISSILCSAALSAGAQDTTLTTLITEPVTIQDLNINTVQDVNTSAVFTDGTGSVLDSRVKVNINNENIREAIKKVIGKADVVYEVDADVPTDVKVSLKADNILLSTAINVITESAGIGCVQTRQKTVTDTDKLKVEISKVHLQFRKAPSSPIGRDRSSYFLNLPAFNKVQWSDKNSNFPNSIFKGADGKSPLGYLFETPKINLAPPNNLLDGMKAYSTSKNAVQPFIYNLTTSEERSTFTCPHCKQQVTIIKKHVSPKCPTCGRTFQDDWKFCPVDGAKRPEDSGDWKFCPHCGKAVS